MIDCASTKGLLSPFLDRMLESSQLGDVESHLKDCAPCRGELESLRRVCALVSGLPKRALPGGFLSKLSARRKAPALPAFGRGYAFGTAAVVIGLIAAGASRFENSQVSIDAVAPAQEPPAGEKDNGPFVSAAPINRETNARGTPLDAGPEAPKNLAAGEAKPLPKPDREIAGVVREDDGERPPGGYGYRPGRAGAPPPSVWEPINREAMQETMLRLQALRSMMGAKEKESVPIEGSTAKLLSRSQPAGPAGGAPLSGAACGDAKDDGICSKDSAPPAAVGEWSGPFGGANEPGGYPIADAGAWTLLWGRLSTGPVPDIDFKTSQVLAVFLGRRPTGGYRVVILDAKETEKALVVSYREMLPTSGKPPPPGATAPYALRIHPRTNLPVRFERVP